MKTAVEHYSVEWVQKWPTDVEPGSLLYLLQPAQIVTFLTCRTNPADHTCLRHPAKLNCYSFVIWISAMATLSAYLPSDPQKRHEELHGRWLASRFYKAAVVLAANRDAREDAAVQAFFHPFIAPDTNHLDFFNHTIDAIRATKKAINKNLDAKKIQKLSSAPIVVPHNFPVDSVLAFELFDYINTTDRSKVLSAHLGGHPGSTPPMLLHLDHMAVVESCNRKDAIRSVVLGLEDGGVQPQGLWNFINYPENADGKHGILGRLVELRMAPADVARFEMSK
jgi:hypothetical protein